MNMKTIFVYFCFACLMLGSVYAIGKEPAQMRILYIGGNSDWNPEAKGLFSEAEFRVGLQKRKDAFAALLRSYFASVTVMDAVDYTPDLSDEYDVTIFDGLPPLLEQKTVEYDAVGKVRNYVPARYLPDDFDAPCITIGEISAKIGQRLGIKNDWFCLCLDSHAHHIVSEHPIFHGPFPVSLTLEERPTPEEAFYYQHLFDEQIPDSLAMWRVQTKGYKSDVGFGVGLVSHPWGYTDSPDCEYISSGVCAKSPDAVAIGRHGNFMTWGFIASPLYMTDEAKTVFVNAVAYMAQFRGVPLARKFDANMATRISIRDMKYAASRASYDNMVKYMNSIKLQQQATYEEVKAKREKGEQLTEQEIAYLQSYQPMEVALPPFAEHLKTAVSPQLYERFGEDEQAYAGYYDEHAPYYYGGEGQQKLTVDEDALAWKIANNDKKILDKAISCLERGEDTERAQRILERYTLCDFTTPGEWRKWYDKYHDRMFFTESGGWIFMIDGSPHIPGNDYGVLERRKARSKTALSVANTEQADLLQPDADNPVVVAATGKMKDAHTMEVSIVINLYKGFHIYKEVGAGDPYVPISVQFELAEGCTLSGDIFMPPAVAFGSGGTLIYEGKVVLSQTIRCTQKPENLKFTMKYQCCDNHLCMPPQDKEFEVKIN